MYKTESDGTTVVLVNPANISKMCSRCGLLVEKTLSSKTYERSSCGLVTDREHNAAISILKLGLQSASIKFVEAHEI